MKVYAFDVDQTLEVSNGPVKLEDLVALRNEGHVIGLCGNWYVAVNRIIGWQHLFAFIGPVGTLKPEFLAQMKTYLPPAEDYVMVGNDKVEGISPNDELFAAQAGWRFIVEADFANGSR